MNPSDPQSPLERLCAAMEGRQAVRAPRLTGDREAAVSVLVRSGEAPQLLLIKRAEIPGDPWSGHVAFPGGRRDPTDPDLLRTALRETREETGIGVEETGRVLGALDEIRPGTRRLPPLVIAPFLAVVPPGTTARPNPREVQAAFWVPLAQLRDENAAGEILIELEEGTRSFPALRYGDHEIWGLTLRILEDFLRIAHRVGL